MTSRSRITPFALVGTVALTLSTLAAAPVVNAAPPPTGSPLAAQAPADTAAKPPHPHQKRPGEPLIVAHRGASGYRPEHTIAAYELAAAMGADYIEPDLVLTKDGMLVDRHEPEIGGTTNVADHPEFADRKTTKNLDGTDVTGWFTEDFTLAELKSLRAVERLPKQRQHNTIYDGLYDVPTFEEVLTLREELSKKHGRTIGIIPEIKHSTYFHEKGLNPEQAFLEAVRKHGLNSKKAPLWLQSFEITNLRAVRDMGYRANSTFLAWTGDGQWDGPYDLLSKGDARKYSDWMKPAGLKEIATFADGIGPEKFFVIPKKADGTLDAPTSLVADAHAAGLKVVPWTFRNENSFMAKDFQTSDDATQYGRAIDEMVTYLRTGIDGLFTDNPDTGVIARQHFLAEKGK
ncbi:glycerophosphoryl diester phosphodiesterase [Kineosphaera limosa]|uniref:glycerophosphodiester phosphodiesterase n=1 Tax=Kineosphaera limosa NBRC 100340 TaxID=1184609 RepID=K6WMT4_9MICO|nr:glycerophosphodiester phosphodiesterase [Kineosphaera limosa]NYE02986.1 glycerophosphoryl diester phosphodiesterase [Kineosphaera limosa]GAB95121.1 glycerophosphoryl diester phosphodiesterase [Kineosphaera limosa NBRC 100340]